MKPNNLSVPISFKPIILSIFLIGFFQESCSTLHAQEIGSPFIHNFSPQVFQAYPQNFLARQGPKGMMYFGNGYGLLVYDGNNWTLHSLPKNGLVRALEVDGNGRVYVGSWGEFGYFEADEKGSLEYHSISALLPLEPYDFGDLWAIHFTDGKVYFQAYSYLFEYEPSANKVKAVNEKFDIGLFSSMVNDTLWIPSLEKGLLFWDGDSMQAVEDGEILVRKFVNNLLPHPKGILVTTRQNDFLLYQGGKFEELDWPIINFLKAEGISGATMLNDSIIAMGTSKAGIVIFTTTGRHITTINTQNGLISDFPRFLFKDRDDGIWAVFNEGISRIDFGYPIRVVNKLNGFKGSPVDVAFHKGNYYLASTQGIFMATTRPLGYQVNNFSKVTGPNQIVFDLEVYDDKLLALDQEGIYEVSAKKSRLIYAGGGGTSLLALPSENLVLLGGWDGVKVLQWKNDNLQLLGVLAGINDYIRFMDGNSINEIWAASNSGNIYQFALNATNFIEISQLNTFGNEQGLPEGETMLMATQDEILISNTQGNLLYNREAASFVPLELEGLPRISQVFLLNKENYLLVFANGKVGYWEKNSGVQYHPYHLLPYTLQLTRSASLNGQTWLLGLEEVYVLNNSTDTKKVPETTLRKVVVAQTDSLLYAGYPSSTFFSPKLPNTFNTLSFDFSSPRFGREAAVQFQYKLENFDKQWSAFSNGNQQTYNNLPNGTYVFKVRASDPLGVVGPEANFSFTILPAWYQTWWAQALLAVVVLAVLSLVVKYFATRKLIRRVEELELLQKVQRERERISLDLHDSVGANLTYIVSNLDFMAFQATKLQGNQIGKKADQLSDYARNTMTLLRETIWSLNKETFSFQEFGGRVQDYARQLIGESASPRFSFQNHLQKEVELSSATALNMYRIVQEAVNNAIKHANAENIIVTVEAAGMNGFLLKIADDGKGMAEIKSPEGHYGLGNMEKRAKELGGTLQICSELEKGTEVSVYLVLPMVQ